MSLRGRTVALVVIAVAIVGGAAAYLAWSASLATSGSEGAAPSEVPLSRVEGRPHIVFRNTAPGRNYGRIGMVTTADPGGPRAISRTTCDRVDVAAGTTLCLRARTGITSAYSVIARRDSDPPLVDVARPGILSRARLSPEGTLAATTAFVAGDSYTSSGFSTRTYVTVLDTGRELHVEDFELVHAGEPIRPIERNYWGVTFVDEDEFYVTVSFGGDTWLARGSVRAERIQTLRKTAECPSVSPDHDRVAYKKREGAGWRIAVLDLASDREKVLPGRRSVDDQVAWLDDDTLLYSLPRTGARAGESDVWSAAADGSSEPRLFIEQASSPAVVG
jgi:hypothetical protein